MTDTPSQQQPPISVRLEPEVAARLTEAVARSDRRSKAYFVNRALEAYFQKAAS